MKIPVKGPNLQGTTQDKHLCSMYFIFSFFLFAINAVSKIVVDRQMVPHTEGMTAENPITADTASLPGRVVQYQIVLCVFLWDYN